MKNPSLSERDRNRQLMPTVAKFVSEFRKIFGEGITVTYASENGIEKGTRGPEGVIPVIGRRRKLEHSTSTDHTPNQAHTGVERERRP